MTTINIRNNFPAVAAQLDRLGQDVGNKAVVRAINTTIGQGKIQMARQISSEFRVSVGEVKNRLIIDRASARGGAYRFAASLAGSGRRGYGRSMNLIAFTEKSISLAAARRRIKAGEGGSHALKNGGRSVHALELRFQIKRGGGKKAIKGAFIGNAGRTVFIRTGKARKPIKALNTIDVPQMFNTRRVNKVVKQVMLDKFPTNFERELRSVLKGYAR